VGWEVVGGGSGSGDRMDAGGVFGEMSRYACLPRCDSVYLGCCRCRKATCAPPRPPPSVHDAERRSPRGTEPGANEVPKKMVVTAKTFQMLV
jgi:hypothetical protein